MRESQPPEQPADTRSGAASRPLTRRTFLRSAGVGAAVASAAGAASPLLLSETTQADNASPSRAQESFQIRGQAAAAERAVPTPRQMNNGDETRYHNFIGNYTQGLPHNGIGEVDPNAYAALLTAVRSGKSSDFGSIPLGGNTKLANPQGGLAFSLEGTDGAQLTHSALSPARERRTRRRDGRGLLDGAGARRAVLAIRQGADYGGRDCRNECTPRVPWACAPPCRQPRPPGPRFSPPGPSPALPRARR